MLAVDFDKMRQFLFVVAYAEETDQAATRGFPSAEVSLRNEPKVEAAAHRAADKFLQQFHQTFVTGPDAVIAFISALDERKARAHASLDTKFAEALKVGAGECRSSGGRKGSFDRRVRLHRHDQDASISTGAVGARPGIAVTGAGSRPALCSTNR